MIVIVDYGLGNLLSVQNMIKKVGYQSLISSDVNVIKAASKIILPGVGSFDEGVKNIDKYGLREILISKAVDDKVPFLGICLGMQLMTNSSEEGSLQGLGLVEGIAKRIPSQINNVKFSVPHIGWNYVKEGKECGLTKNFPKHSRFYFVHSYYVELEDSNLTILKTNYGIEFTSAFAKSNILGVQFHPEKSHRFGKQLIENFVKNF